MEVCESRTVCGIHRAGLYISIFPSPKSIGRAFLNFWNFIGEKSCGKRRVKEIEQESKEKTSDEGIDEELRKELENIASKMISKLT